MSIDAYSGVNFLHQMQPRLQLRMFWNRLSFSFECYSCGSPTTLQLHYMERFYCTESGRFRHSLCRDDIDLHGKHAQWQYHATGRDSVHCACDFYCHFSNIHMNIQSVDTPNIRLHLDGARLWNASAETGIPIADWCEHFDSVSLCLSKGFNRSGSFSR